MKQNEALHLGAFVLIFFMPIYQAQILCYLKVSEHFCHVRTKYFASASSHSQLIKRKPIGKHKHIKPRCRRVNSAMFGMQSHNCRWHDCSN